VGNIEDPVAKLKICSAKPAGKLLRPLRGDSGLVSRPHERNRPRSKNSKHHDKANKMRRVQQCAPIPFLPKHRDDHAVEKQKMDGAFGKPSKAEKNKRHRPNKPWGFFLEPEAQPKNDRERAKRHVERLDFD